MPIIVEMPDGTEREFPSETREIESKEIRPDRQAVTYEAPIFDPDWRFLPVMGGKYRAVPRRRK